MLTKAEIQTHEIIKPKRTYYLDYLRILATFFVVFLHTSADKILNVPIGGGAWYIFTSYNSTVRWVVPMFAMISGALFLNPLKKLSLKNLYLKNILRIVTSYIFWALAYSAFYNRQAGIAVIIKSAITGHYHLWFLLMLVGVYIIIPLLRKITEDKSATKYYIAVALVFSFMLPLALRLLNKPYLSTAYGSVYFHFTLGYSCYFVIGYFLATADFSKLSRAMIYLLGVLGTFATAALTIFGSLKNQINDFSWFDNFSPFVLLACSALFIFARYELSRINVSDKVGKLISSLSKYSFGVYLIHAFVLDRLTAMGLTTVSFHALISVPAISILIFVISLAVSFVLNRIPFVNKFLV